MVAHPGCSFKRLFAPMQRWFVPPIVPPDDPCPHCHPAAPLPAWVADDPVVQKYRALIGDLPWAQFPERPTDRPYPGQSPAPASHSSPPTS
jgi:hypothetical protein